MALSDSLAALATAIGNLDSDDEAKAAQIATLTAELATANDSVTSLTAQLAAAPSAADVQALQDQLDAADTQVQALTAQVNSILNPPAPVTPPVDTSTPPATPPAADGSGSAAPPVADTPPVDTTPAPPVPEAFSFTDPQLSVGAGLALSGSLASGVSGGVGPFTYAVTGQPSNVTVDPNTGAVSSNGGVAAGQTVAQVTVTDSTGATAAGTLTITAS
jgi:hypothetical protein